MRRLAVLGLLALAAPALAQTPVRVTADAPVVLDAGRMQSIAFGTPRLRDSGPRAGKEVRGNLYDVPYWTYANGPLPAPPTAEPGKAGESATAFGYAHVPDVSFDGPGQNGFAPADCHMAAGYGHVIAVINSEFWIYDKRGQMQYHTTLDSLFGVTPGYGGSFDPKVRFDPVRNRFYMLALDAHPTQALAQYKLAISITSDPTQGWYLYVFANELGGRGIDYPELGFGPRGLYLTGNYIPFQGWPPPSMGFRGSTWVLPLDALVQGQGFTYWRFDDMRGVNNEVVGTLKTPGSGAAHAPGVDAVTIALGSGPNSTLRRALFYGWTLPGNFPTSAPSFTRPWLDIAESLPVPNARQRGGPAQMITNNLGSVFLGASIANGRIATALPVEGNGRCNTRTYLFDVSGWPSVSVVHTLDFSGTASGLDFYWPNSAVNGYGEQGVVYSQSSPIEFVSSYWTMRQRDQGGYPQYGSVAAGTAYNGFFNDTPASAYRWGDYAGIDVDPIGHGFWYFDSRAVPGPFFGTRLVHVPHAEFVDFAGPGFPQGTRSQPWNQFTHAITNARDENHVVVRAGSYTVPVGYTITKRLRIMADPGVVTIAP